MIKNSIFRIIFLIIILQINLLLAQRRIVSLAPGYTYQLYKLNRGNSIIANTTYCRRPTEAQNKEKIGSVVNIDVEKIYALQPDLVISSTLSRKNQIRKLRQLGIRVEVFQRPQSYQDIIDQYAKLAKYVERQNLAIKQLDSLQNEIRSIRMQLQGKKSRKIFFQIGSNPLYAANKKSFINNLIEMANGINVVQTDKTGAFNRESIIARNPAIIFIALNGNKSQIEKEKWQKYKSIDAVSNNKIFMVDPNIFCTPTPFTFTQALAQMVELIYPNQ